MKKGTLRKVLHYAGKYRGLVFLSLILAVVTAALALYIPILAGGAIDLLVGEGNVDFTKVMAVLMKMLTAILFTAICQWVMNKANNVITFKVVRDVRAEAFDKLQTLPFEYLDKVQSGEIVSRIVADIDLFADGLLMGFTQLFTGIVTILFTLVFMFYLNFRIAIVVVALTPLSLTFMIPAFSMTRINRMMFGSLILDSTNRMIHPWSI